MVHRPADSRLLSNLISHEKDYSKALSSFLDASESSLGSFSAYASASSPPSSQAIIAVATSFAGANDALRKYAVSVEEWREQLKALQGLEDEVGNIMRDREILVTRLIKASKQQKSNRDSLHYPLRSSSLSSDSISSLGSLGSSKLTQAQAELQACEAHLASKERELEYMRVGTIVHGLKGRCTALVECGWIWGEAGKEALRALDELVLPNGVAPHQNLPYSKPLPEPDTLHQSSDISSSLSPSQSASQINFPVFPTPPPPETAPHERTTSYLLNIPAAHAITDQLFPPSIQRRITEEDEDELEDANQATPVPGTNAAAADSSDESEDERPIEVHENNPFGGQPSKVMPKLSIRTTKSAPKAPQSTRSDVGPRYNDTTIKRERKRSNLFGALAGFFRGKSSASSTSSVPDSPSYASPSKFRWTTRTDRNLRRNTTGGDDSSDDERITGRASDAIIDYSSLRRKSVQEAKPVSVSPTAKAESSVKPAGTVRRLRKSSAPPKAQTAAENTVSGAATKDDGWMSDGAMATSRSTSVKRAGRSLSPAGTKVEDGLSRSNTMRSTKSTETSGTATDVPRRRNSKNKGRSASMQSSETIIPVGTQASVSRSNSARSSDPDPAKRKKTAADSLHRGIVKSETWSEPSLGKQASPQSQKRSLSVDFSRGETNLMSIVEGVTKQNRQAWGKGNPNNLLLEVKAPRGITTLDLATPLIQTIQKSSLSPLPVSRPLPVSDPRRLSLTMTSASSPSLPLNNSTSMGHSYSAVTVIATTGSSDHPQRSVIVPLKSALRNRTPSPNPTSSTSQTVTPRSTSPVRKSRPTSRLQQVSVPVYSEEPESIVASSSSMAVLTGSPPVIIPSVAKVDDDAASIASSSATGQEVFEDANEEIPPTPPAEDDKPNPFDHLRQKPEVHVPNGKTAEDTELSFSSDTTSTPTFVPTRRKSVRMSLQPTFSPTPPALDADEDDEIVPWGPASSSSTGKNKEKDKDESWKVTQNGHTHGWHSRVNERQTIGWDDSSEEDEEYSRARRLLNKTARKLAGMR